jgi:hypothetical protein
MFNKKSAPQALLHRGCLHERDQSGSKSSPSEPILPSFPLVRNQTLIFHYHTKAVLDYIAKYIFKGWEEIQCRTGDTNRGFEAYRPFLCCRDISSQEISHMSIQQRPLRSDHYRGGNLLTRSTRAVWPIPNVICISEMLASFGGYGNTTSRENLTETTFGSSATSHQLLPEILNRSGLRGLLPCWIDATPSIRWSKWA